MLLTATMWSLKVDNQTKISLIRHLWNNISTMKMNNLIPCYTLISYVIFVHEIFFSYMSVAKCYYFYVSL